MAAAELLAFQQQVQTAECACRVVPLHSFKHIAEMQYQLVKQPGSKQTNPIIARIDTNAGHGAGKPTSKRIEEGADMLAFAAAVCGANIVQL
jgi:prolyl oligopeptidase